MSKNKKWSSAAKFEIALQALKNETTLNEICKKYDVSPSQVHACPTIDAAWWNPSDIRGT